MSLEASEINLQFLPKLQTPCYIYSQRLMVEAFRKLQNMESAYGLEIQYAMKANSNAAILKIFKDLGAKIDASSLNEARRALLAGFKHEDITYTTQEIVEGKDREDMLQMVVKGMKFNVCSMRQYLVIRDVAKANHLPLSVRIHPETGSGESITRDTGGKYSCFGVNFAELEGLVEQAETDGVSFDQIHIHIGSGGKKEAWIENVRNELNFARKYFKNLKRIDFGGGLKIARMPEQMDLAINVKDIEQEMKLEMLKYGQQTNTKPITVIEPGTFLVANSGFIVTQVLDKKSSSQYKFLIVNGGMELNCRPLMYGSKHPFYVVSKEGKLLSSEFALREDFKQLAIVGRCCESGDSQSLDEDTKKIIPRKMAEPQIGDFVVIGGAGAYCSSMSPFNYNSHIQAPEYLYDLKGNLRVIRRAQTLEQIIQNEVNEELKL